MRLTEAEEIELLALLEVEAASEEECGDMGPHEYALHEWAKIGNGLTPADTLTVLSAATAPETMAVAGEVPAAACQQSKLSLDWHTAGMAYRPLPSTSPPGAMTLTCALKLE